MKVIQVIPALVIGGAEVMCETLSCALKQCNIEVVVVSLFNIDTVISQRLQASGIKVIFLNKKRGIDLNIIFSLKKVFEKEKPDVVHSHLSAHAYAVPAAMMVNIKKRIHTIHNIASSENGKVVRALAYFFFKFCHTVPVALSKEVQKTIIDEYHLPAEQIPIIFNGIDLSHYIPDEHHSTNNVFTIIHVGRFSAQKNHRQLLLAFQKVLQRHTNVKLVLVGDGELKTQMEQFSQELQLTNKVIFLGIKENIQTELKNADAFVLPSKYEGIPISIIEAMAMGLPILASCVGGVRDMLTENVTALFCTPEADSIANGLCELIEHPELCKRLGNNARSASATFSAKIMAAKYISVYNGKGQR